MRTLAASLSTGDTIELIGMLLGVVFGVSFLFQRIGEARLKHLVALREEVDQTVEKLESAIQSLQSAQELSAVTIASVVRSLDLLAAYVEANGGVILDLATHSGDSSNPNYAEVHSRLVRDLRRSNDELRLLSGDDERRLSAVKNLAFGQANFRALEIVSRAATLYPDDANLARFKDELTSHLRGSPGP